MPASCGASRSCARAAWRRSCISRSNGCRSSPAWARRRYAAACWWRRRPTTSSAPTTTPSTASSPAAPMLEITVPSVADPGLAPPGAHVMSVIVQYAPHTHRGRLGRAARALYGRGHRHAGGLCAGAACFDTCQRTAHAGGHRAAVPHQRRTLASCRAGAGPVFHGAPGCGRSPVSCTGAGRVPVRRGLSPRRWRDGACRPQRGAAGAARGGVSMLTESEPHYRQPLRKTPFHERARALSQLDSFIPWSGYTTVDVFTSVEQEYFAIRNASLALRPDPDGQVPRRRAGRAALSQPPHDARHAQADTGQGRLHASGATTRAT